MPPQLQLAGCPTDKSFKVNPGQVHSSPTEPHPANGTEFMRQAKWVTDFNLFLSILHGTFKATQMSAKITYIF
jgi:hypothetical protein